MSAPALPHPHMPEALVRHQLHARRVHARDDAARARVDEALERLDQGTWGICRVCNDPIESDRLAADPLLEFCIDHLTRGQRAALQSDLELAVRVQSRLHPPRQVVHGGWLVASHAEAARVVGGDYLDVIPDAGGGLHALVGDVSGKGVAASMLATHLHATFRALVPMGLSLEALLAHVNRLVMASTLPTQYATLAAVRASASGEAEVAVAGHPALLLSRAAAPGSVERLESTGVPLGLFDDPVIGARTVRLDPGDALLLYTDGVTEAPGSGGEMYGEERLAALLRRLPGAEPDALLRHAMEDLRSFRTETSDDATMMVIARRAP